MKGTIISILKGVYTLVEHTGQTWKPFVSVKTRQIFRGEQYRC